jgi:hypothetical protein
MKKYLWLVIIFLIGIAIGYLISSNINPDSKVEYGETGFPKNCRAIIKENIDGYKSGEYSAEDIIDSIDRNCGEFGYSWSE